MSLLPTLFGGLMRKKSPKNKSVKTTKINYDNSSFYATRPKPMSGAKKKHKRKAAQRSRRRNK